jgi:hypothetical protein
MEGGRKEREEREEREGRGGRGGGEGCQERELALEQETEKCREIYPKLLPDPSRT